MDGATQIPISECEARWHNSRLCVLYFQLCKFQFCLLAAYFISVNNCSCSDRNFGQTGGDLSFGVPYPFQRYWPHSRRLLFVLWPQYGRFTESPHLLASAPASQGETCWLSQGGFETASGLKINPSISHCLCIGVEAYFYGWCNPNPDFGI